jgi:hypothetical protein
MVQDPRPAATPSEKDASPFVSCSSPPCFLHELDPSYLGYLRQDEVLELLTSLLAINLASTTLETAWVHVMLRRHIARLGGPRACPPNSSQETVRPKGAGSLGASSAPGPDHLQARLEDALPRLYDDALRQDLEQVLSMLKRDKQRTELRRCG